MEPVKMFYRVVWRVSLPCSCPILRTMDRDAAVAAAKPGYILDAIPVRNAEAEARELGGATGCGCGS